MLPMMVRTVFDDVPYEEILAIADTGTTPPFWYKVFEENYHVLTS